MTAVESHRPSWFQSVSKKLPLGQYLVFTIHLLKPHPNRFHRAEHSMADLQQV